jgi:DNA topoisomerase-1
MGKSLVIVESPAKAKTINKYLGSNYIVKSSVGHVRDLPTSSKNKPAATKTPAEVRKMSPEAKAEYKKLKDYNALIARMGIDPKNNWHAYYDILPGKEKVVAELQKLAEKADHIYLASDLDREGEAIAWHLQEIIGGDKDKFKRVVFNEITKSAIEQAFSEPGEVNIARVNAQQTRRFFRPNRWFYGISTVVEEGCKRFVSRSCSICSGSLSCGKRA